MTFQQRMIAQVLEALSDDNRWYAGEKLHHQPTDIEATNYYLHSEGPVNFAKKEFSQTEEKQIQQI